MKVRKNLSSRLFIAFLFVIAGTAWMVKTAPAQNQPGFPNAVMPENTAMQVSNHVYAIVAREAQKLGKNTRLYLTTTHYHAEHAAGDNGFPADTILIRPVAQQEEMDQRGLAFIDRFRGMSALNKELLQDVKLRTPDIVYQREMTIDLGDVTARLFWFGTAHTKGDEFIYVKEDGTLLSGDIVQNKLVPNLPDDNSSMKGWLAILGQLAPLKPRFIVPDHGALGDGSLIAQQRAFMVDVQTRALALKREGKSADDVGKLLAAEFKAKYPDWTGNGVPNMVRTVYTESQ